MLTQVEVVGPGHSVIPVGTVVPVYGWSLEGGFLGWYDDAWVSLAPTLVRPVPDHPEGDPAQFLQANGDLLDAVATLRICIHAYLNPTTDARLRTVQGAILHALDELADFAGQAGIEGFRHPDTQ